MKTLRTVALLRQPGRLARLGGFCSLIVLLAALAGIPQQTGAQMLSDIGYIGPSHGGLSAPTGEKPESKLWYHGGYWWANLYNSEAQEHRIYRFDPATYEWIDTGTPLDRRNSTKADILWDEATGKLYVVSHVFSTDAAPTLAESNWGILLRYSYDPAILRYILDDGFPVYVTKGKSETLTIAKDSTGQLWVAYVESRQVMFNNSQGDDRLWGEPRVLPVPNAVALSSDDIAAVTSFGGSQIGIAWSHQRHSAMYFAVHADGMPDDVWIQETIVAQPYFADDHLNFATDRTGRVFLASKTSAFRDAPLVVLYVREPGGRWDVYSFGIGYDGHTRPIVVIDEEQERVHMFAAAPETGGLIYHKQSDLNAIAFPPGQGEVVLYNAIDTRLNNVTSTKQNVDLSTGLLILASGYSNRYFFNYFTLTEPPPVVVPEPAATVLPSPVPGGASATPAPAHPPAPTAPVLP